MKTGQILKTLFRSLINVGNIAAANQPQFPQLHLLDQALQFFRSLPQATRDNFESIQLQPSETIIVTQTSENYTNYSFKT